MPKVRFLYEMVEAEAKSGQRLRDVARDNGVEVHRGFWAKYHCRGTGLCGGCKVWVTRGSDHLSPMSLLERLFCKSGRGFMRLGCQARVQGDIEVRTRRGGDFPQQSLEVYPEPKTHPNMSPPKKKKAS